MSVNVAWFPDYGNLMAGIYLSFMIQPEYKKKNNTIFIGFDSIKISLINKLINLKIQVFLSNSTPTWRPN